MSSLLPLSLDDDEPKKLSVARKLFLLLMFCLAQFMDTFSTTSLLSAIPTLETSMGMNEAQSTWVISAFRLTFSSFLLIVRAHLLTLTCALTHCSRVAVSATYTTQVSAMLPVSDIMLNGMQKLCSSEEYPVSVSSRYVPDLFTTQFRFLFSER
jgi:MFS family permease